MSGAVWLKRRAESTLHGLVNLLRKREWERQRLRRNERPIDLRFVFEWVCRLSPDTLLDVGTGISPLPALLRNCGLLVTATDNVAGYWPHGLFNYHYYVVNDDITSTRLSGPFDMVVCAGVLQHVPRHADAVRSMFSLLAPGGHLLISCPYNEGEYVPNAYLLPEAGYGQHNPYVCQQHDRRNRDLWLEQNDAELVDQEYWRVFSGKYWTYGEVLKPPARTSAADEHQFTCLVLRKRRA